MAQRTPPTKCAGGGGEGCGGFKDSRRRGPLRGLGRPGVAQRGARRSDGRVQVRARARARARLRRACRGHARGRRGGGARWDCGEGVALPRRGKGLGQSWFVAVREGSKQSCVTARQPPIYYTPSAGCSLSACRRHSSGKARAAGGKGPSRPALARRGSKCNSMGCPKTHSWRQA
ncbi:MAG: hypothetical protein J3K34DRAFT_438737 [Monoraphidium minutum]|nr:MAG: hypothetical protein J3K34DRAFT_438737 [Monoraphidium minutum]